MTPLISRKAVNELQEYFVGTTLPPAHAVQIERSGSPHGAENYRALATVELTETIILRAGGGREECGRQRDANVLVAGGCRWRP